jgi:hypothetical protein
MFYRETKFGLGTFVGSGGGGGHGKGQWDFGFLGKVFREEFYEFVVDEIGTDRRIRGGSKGVDETLTNGEGEDRKGGGTEVYDELSPILLEVWEMWGW